MLGALVRLVFAPALRRAESKGRSCGSMLLGLVFLAGGAGLGWLSAHWLMRAADATSWPTAAGVVAGSRDASGRMEYRYGVGGREYTGTHIRSIHVVYRGAMEREDVGRLRPGNPCRVFYSPQDPADACLVPEAGAGPWILAGFAAVLAMGGVLMLVKR